jgi:hypothetical protein
VSARAATAWRQAVKAARWSAYERVYRASALDLADIADPHGMICVRRDVLAERLGLSPRALDYHLAWLIKHQWIERGASTVTHGRPAQYRLTRSQDVANGSGQVVRNPQRAIPPKSFATPLRTHIDSANAGERVAVKGDAPDEPATAALASATQPITQLQPSKDEEDLEQQPAFVAHSSDAREDDITRAARVLEAQGLLHRDRSLRLVHDSAVAS